MRDELGRVDRLDMRHGPFNLAAWWLRETSPVHSRANRNLHTAPGRSSCLQWSGRPGPSAGCGLGLRRLLNWRGASGSTTPCAATKLP